MNLNKTPQNVQSGWSPFIAIAVTSLAAIAISVYCLLSGWVIIFQNLFYVPIIIACVYYTKKGFAFSVALSLIYLFLIIAFTRDSAVIVQALIRVVIFAGIAGVVTFLSIKRKRMEKVLLESEELKRDEESLRSHSERLRNLHRVDQAILQALETPETIVLSALKHFPSLLSCQRASVGIFDMKKKQVRVFAADIGGETVVQVGKNLAEEAYGDLEILRQDRMEIVEDMSKVKSPPAIIRILQVEGIQSCINVPLFSGDNLIGAMNVGWNVPKTFHSEEIEIAHEVAIQIAIAIEHARLLNEIKLYAAELEERVRERTTQLEESNKELEAFTYSVSHDLRAPLRYINGYVDLLVNRFPASLPEKGKHYLDSIADSVRQMGTLIDDLLQFSRTSRQDMRQTQVDMNQVLAEVLATIKRNNPERAIDWRIAALPDVSGDPAMLRLVWFNLLDNAVKFTRTIKKARVEIGVREENEEFVFSVRDNGVGFDMRYAQKLFGVFQRLHPSAEYEGTGIGLANVQRIILRHGGRTWAEAELDKGATFFFSIPNKKEDT